MSRSDTQVTAAAGEHFVAFRLSQLGLVVGIPRAGVPGVDLLVTDPNTHAMASIQVKTARSALRTRGRGKNKMVHHLEFPLGQRAGTTESQDLFVAFVDLHGRDPASCPDVYLYPSSVVVSSCASWVDKVKWVRWHVAIADASEFKNNWNPIMGSLE